MKRHKAHPARTIDGRNVCACGREVVVKVVRRTLPPFSPIRDRFGMAVWRASHGEVMEPERWAKWRAAGAIRPRVRPF